MTSYRLIIHLFLPFILLYTMKIAFRCRSLKYFLQRTGFLYPVVSKDVIWLHCASVGEVNTALPLVRSFIEQNSDQKFLLTTVTPTGAEMVARAELANVSHCYLPVDLYFCVRRFIKKVNPQLALILETELWPELYNQANKNAVPITIVNGRLSTRTLQANNWLKKHYQSALNLVSHVMARSEADRKGFIELGCDAEKVEVLGNLKFACRDNIKLSEIVNFTERNFILAASTHNDEEAQLARMWKEIDSKGRLLVIAPRHPERGREIDAALDKLGLKAALRSQQDVITDDTEIYIADTLGELVNFMAKAEIVFMGGSLIKHGGQNILEPARLAKPVIIGPHFYNFQQEVDLFLEHDACIQVQGLDQLADVIKGLLDNEQRKKDLSFRAGQLMMQQKDVAEKYRDRIIAHYSNYLL